MKLKYVSIVTIFLAFVYLAYTQTTFLPPPTKQIPVRDTLFGIVITDFYRWLEDKDNPEVKVWSKAQHNYTIEYIKGTTKEIPGLHEEIRSYLDRDYVSAPFFKAKREFFYARRKGEQQSKLFTRLDGREKLIFDPMKIDSTGKTAISSFVLNKDASKAAIGVQTRGNEIIRYYFVDTKTGKEIAPPLDNVYSLSWCRNEKFAYVTYRSAEDIKNQVPLKTFLHRIGEEPTRDKFLFAPKDAKDFASTWDDEDTDLTFISEGDFYSNTLKIQKGNSNPSLIFQSDKCRATPLVRNNRIYFFTNYEAPNYKIMVADFEHPEFEHWKPLIPEMDVPIEDYEVTTDYILVHTKRDVLSQLLVYSCDGKFLKQMELPELGNIGSMSYHKETNSVYVSLMTFTSPSKLYKLDGKSLEWIFVFQDKSPINTEQIESKQVFYTSKDGTKIPMFIVYKKGLKLDGNNPTLLYGYGGFNVGMSPHYIGVTASFVNRGGVYAVACLRGGDEYGENWHRQGMLLNKQNVFDDFISAAEYLIAEKYTNPRKLAIKGSSNGGLLIGAVVTQRPDLFRAGICGVPLLDMIRYHKFLIARYWIPEYGDPDKEEDFRNLLKYSPYHNVRVGLNIPTLLIKAGENDTRVDPLHAKKFAALLQNSEWQTNPILLYIDFESGHGSGQSIEQQVNNIEIEWQWLMNQLGM